MIKFLTISHLIIWQKYYIYLHWLEVVFSREQDIWVNNALNEIEIIWSWFRKLKKRLGTKKFIWSLKSCSSCGKTVVTAPHGGEAGKCERCGQSTTSNKTVISSYSLRYLWNIPSDPWFIMTSLTSCLNPWTYIQITWYLSGVLFHRELWPLCLQGDFK